MLDLAAAAAFLTLAALHLPPALAERSADGLRALYGGSALADDALVLLRHRAAQFALVAGLCLVAAFWPPARATALVVCGWSMASFLLVYALAGAAPGPLRRIALADLAGLPVLALAAAPLTIG
jgi:hypothetical protein